MTKRVLSIQSHVVHGYVGNKAAVFPLQLLGFDVDFINSVHFSNHTGYPNGLKGDVLNGDQLRSILQGLEANDLLQDVGYLLTGYIGSVSFLEAVIDVLKTIRQHNPDLVFVCDPVLGDDHRFYVPQELVQVYRTAVLPLANVVTPNQFEVEQLTGIQVNTTEDAKRACQALHEMMAAGSSSSVVFLTSAILTDDDDDAKDEAPDKNNTRSRRIAIIASQRKRTKPNNDDDNKHNNTDDEDQDELWKITCPLLPGKFTGTGDLTASLLLAHLAKQSQENNLPAVMEKVINTMYVVIERTMKKQQQRGDDTVQSKELQLIQSKGDIENPPSTYKAVRL